MGPRALNQGQFHRITSKFSTFNIMQIVWSYNSTLVHADFNLLQYETPRAGGGGHGNHMMYCFLSLDIVLAHFIKLAKTQSLNVFPHRDDFCNKNIKV